MVGSVYCFRRSARTPQLIFWIEGDALWWSGDDEKQRLEFPDIREVRLTERYPQRRSALGGKRIWVAEFVGSRGAATVLSPLHLNRDGRWDDRSGDYYRFLNELLDRLKAANPNLAIVHRQHWYVRIGRAAARARAQLGGWALVGLVKACRPLPPDGLAAVGGAIARLVGPFSHGHRLARANLAASFPQHSADEIKRIISGMWENLGRVCAEFVHLERFWDYDRNGTTSSPVYLDQKTLGQVSRLRASGGPRLYFTAHLANWEVTAILATAFGSESELAVVYRPVELGAAARVVMTPRARAIGTLISSDRGAASRLRNALKRGMHVAMLVDEHFRGGIPVTFFGRPCTVNPTLARFARLFDCPVHGLRAIRLDDNRLTVNVTDALELPRAADGKIDVAEAMQLITSIVEGWVREHPEQWIWLRRRWR